MKSITLIVTTLFLSLAGSLSWAQVSCADVFGSAVESNFTLGLVNGIVHLKGRSNPFQNEWDQLPKHATDLVKIDPSRFTLLVHAGSSPRKVEKLLQNNQLLEQSFNISTSLIDQNHRSTYGNYGVIISAPPRNILATSSSDMGTPLGKIVPASDIQKMQQEELFYSFLMTANPVRPPESILASTKSYNEIMVAGTTSTGGPVRIIGVFLKTKNSEVVAAPEVVEKLNNLAKKLDLPTIKIEAMPDSAF